MSTLVSLVRSMNAMLQLVPSSIALLGLRVAVSIPFWNSGVLKWESFPVQVNDTAVTLFAEEFKLHILGNEIPFPFPAVTAHLVALAEVTLPVLLIAGLLSRLSAFALVLMTIVIQLTVPSGWAIHLTWAAMALAVVSYGGGKISLDNVFGFDR